MDERWAVVDLHCEHHRGYLYPPRSSGVAATRWNLSHRLGWQGREWRAHPALDRRVAELAEHRQAWHHANRGHARLATRDGQSWILGERRKLQLVFVRLSR